ncbi:hypothetical protein HF329_00680 [Chitinophaga oryzae]|uniref:ATP-binding protein n=1 Tax=Chitinophaga oryzae TaxID=2725414 RepID=A0AAE6ZBI9_9BACT|nr:hypothetical protein [Chitinophaga oryzae]QJB29898.1 hypothetical protein HF329_00680 [Chitinophaga oryzae]
MTYRDKFNASEHKAHYKNIATKVLREMSLLRSNVETSPNTPRRWVWELLQNAKDVHRGNGVKIEISQVEQSGKNYLIFRHDGLPFTADNVRFLIEQISSKDREKDSGGKQKQTGKFGTGFLTTHMLSEKVKVKGVAKEDELDYREFSLILDRSGYELHEIISAVEKSKKAIEDMDDFPTYTGYNENDYNTSFIYPLIDSLSKQVANLGLTDLGTNLPYTLCFVDEINSVTVKPSGLIYYVVSRETEDFNSEIQIITISIDLDTKVPKTPFKVAVLSKGLTSIALPVQEENGCFTILPIDGTVPRIFCDFPLIGTEAFPFPTIINNPNFNPTDPRDGIFLTDSTRANPLVEENKNIVKDAVDLYFNLLRHAISNNWGNLHLLARLGYLREPILANTSVDWFEKVVQKPVREMLMTSKIVKTAGNTLCSILKEDGVKYMWFPSGGSKEVREKIWEIAQYWFPHALPQKENVEFWSHNIWSDCGKLTLSQFSTFLQNKETLSNLKESLKGIEPIEWLNKFYQLLQLDEKEFVSILDAKSIVPDQNGSLVKKSLLSKQVGDIDDAFKDILLLFKNDIRSKLADTGIKLEFEDQDLYDQTDAVREITSEIIEKTNDREVAQNYRPALNLIIKYFSDHPEEAKKLFPSIYKNKHLLYDDEEIMDNINKAEELKDLLSTFKVSSADELRRKFEGMSSGQVSLLPVTEEILASMGITSVEEWEEAMRDTDLQSLFDHRSIPSPDMFVFAQSHIKRAKKRVIQYLESLDEYDLSGMDSNTATTILAGVRKYGHPIRIVFRPAYNREVIIYYGAERDTLDYADCELWVDDGSEVWSVSLGHIIKKNNIKKFPI